MPYLSFDFISFSPHHTSKLVWIRLIENVRFHQSFSRLTIRASSSGFGLSKTFYIFCIFSTSSFNDTTSILGFIGQPSCTGATMNEYSG